MRKRAGTDDSLSAFGTPYRSTSSVIPAITSAGHILDEQGQALPDNYGR